MKHPTTRQLYAYWSELRAEIDPGAIRHILADTFTLRPDSAGRYRFRSAGTRCCALFGRDLRTTPFADLWLGRSRSDMQRMIDAVLEETVGVAAGLRGGGVELELILLPLRSRSGRRAGLIGAIVPTSPLGWSGVSAIEPMEIASMRIVRPAQDDALPAPAAEPRLAPRQRFVVHEGGRA